MTPVTETARADKQARKGALLFCLVYLIFNDVFEELWFPKAILTFEFRDVFSYKVWKDSKLNKQMLFHEAH